MRVCGKASMPRWDRRLCVEGRCDAFGLKARAFLPAGGAVARHDRHDGADGRIDVFSRLGSSHEDSDFEHPSICHLISDITAVGRPPGNGLGGGMWLRGRAQVELDRAQTSEGLRKEKRSAASLSSSPTMRSVVLSLLASALLASGFVLPAQPAAAVVRTAPTGVSSALPTPKNPRRPSRPCAPCAGTPPAPRPRAPYSSPRCRAPCARQWHGLRARNCPARPVSTLTRVLSRAQWRTMFRRRQPRSTRTTGRASRALPTASARRRRIRRSLTFLG